LNALLRSAERAAEMGRAGRARAVEEFSWQSVAEQTAALYSSLV
jgi:starch synthase